MNLPPGLYQKLISDTVSKELDKLKVNHEITQSKLETSEIPDILAQYLHSEISESLRAFSGKQARSDQIQLSNRIVEVLKAAFPKTRSDEKKPGAIPKEPWLLQAVNDQAN